LGGNNGKHKQLIGKKIVPINARSWIKPQNIWLTSIVSFPPNYARNEVV